MRNYFIILICFFLLSCSSAQEIINRGEVKTGMSQKDLRYALISTSLSEDPFLKPCLRKYFRDEKVLIIAAEAQTTFFIFENVNTPGNCRSYGDGKLVTVRYNYQNALNFIKSNYLSENNNYSSNKNLTNKKTIYNKEKNSYLKKYKKQLVDLNYIEPYFNTIISNKISDEFHLAILKFLIDEGECDLAVLITSSTNIRLRYGNNNYCINNLYKKYGNIKKNFSIEEIYNIYIFSNKFSSLLDRASNRIS